MIIKWYNWVNERNDVMKKSCYSSQFKKGIISISIDDGNAEDFRLYESVLLKYNLSATFNIISNVIDGKTTMTKEQLKTIYNNPSMEIAAHGFSHKNDDEDILTGVSELRLKVGITEKLIGFASPESRMKNDFIEENYSHLRDLGLLYVRTAGNPVANNRHLEIQDKLQLAGESDYVIRNIPQLIYSFNSLCVNSVVVYNHTSLDDLKKLVDIAEVERACIVFMFHKTNKKGEFGYDDLWSYDLDEFEVFAEYLNQKRSEGVIDVLTTKQAFLSSLI